MSRDLQKVGVAEAGVKDLDGLMTEEEYKKFTDEESDH